MRRISFILAILLFAVPALAKVEVFCTNNSADPNTVLVSYRVTMTGEPNKVRAYALDITVDKGAKITGISGFKRGESVPNNLGYGIFPGSFDKYNIDPDDPNWADPNYSPLADPCDYPSDTKGGLNTSGITVELGTLYFPTKDNSPNAPPLTGDLLKFTV